jgi:hypothetical protein
VNFVEESSNSYYQCKLPTTACSGGKDRKTCVHNLFIESLIPGKQGTCIISTLNTGQNFLLPFVLCTVTCFFFHTFCVHTDCRMQICLVCKWRNGKPYNSKLELSKYVCLMHYTRACFTFFEHVCKITP